MNVYTDMVNLTPHAINIKLDNGEIATYLPSGYIARVETTEEVGISHNGIPVITRTMGKVSIDCPEEGQSTAPKFWEWDACLVSSMVLAAMPAGTPGVYAPDTGPTAIRENGQVVAVTRLVAA